jgi:hypothetical protein
MQDQSSHVTEALHRARLLLSPDRIKTSLVETAADPSPESIGAQAGIGFTVKDSEVRFSVYVFSDWEASRKAVEAFVKQYEGDEKIYVATTMNGPLVFYGILHLDGPNSTDEQFQLADLLSAFAGDE